MGTLLFAIAMSLAAAASANAGLTALHSAPNDLPNMSRLAALYSTPNDLPDPLNAEYFAWALSPNEKITVAALMFINTRGRTKERDDRLFINQGIGNNFAVQNILMSNRLDSLGGKPQNLNTIIDFGKLGFWDVLSAYAKTTPGTDQADLEIKIDPDYNDISYDPKPVIDTETRT